MPCLPTLTEELLHTVPSVTVNCNANIRVDMVLCLMACYRIIPTEVLRSLLAEAKDLKNSLQVSCFAFKIFFFFLLQFELFHFFHALRKSFQPLPWTECIPSGSVARARLGLHHCLWNIYWACFVWQIKGWQNNTKRLKTLMIAEKGFLKKKRGGLMQ